MGVGGFGVLVLYIYMKMVFSKYLGNYRVYGKIFYTKVVDNFFPHIFAIYGNLISPTVFPENWKNSQLYIYINEKWLITLFLLIK